MTGAAERRRARRIAALRAREAEGAARALTAGLALRAQADQAAGRIASLLASTAPPTGRMAPATLAAGATLRALLAPALAEAERRRAAAAAAVLAAAQAAGAARARAEAASAAQRAADAALRAEIEVHEAADRPPRARRETIR